MFTYINLHSERDGVLMSDFQEGCVRAYEPPERKTHTCHRS